MSWDLPVSALQVIPAGHLSPDFIPVPLSVLCHGFQEHLEGQDKKKRGGADEGVLQAEEEGCACPTKQQQWRKSRKGRDSRLRWEVKGEIVESPNGKGPLLTASSFGVQAPRFKLGSTRLVHL